MRCVSANWPQVIRLNKIQALTRRVWKMIANRNPRVRYWLVPAGFSCQDISALNRAFSAGLVGARSLLYTVIRPGSPKDLFLAVCFHIDDPWKKMNNSYL